MTAPSEVDEVKALARRYERDLARAAAAHGARWPEHRAWVEAYLDEQLRQHLAIRGWRPGHDV